MPKNDEEICIRVLGNEAMRGFPEFPWISHASLLVENYVTSSVEKRLIGTSFKTEIIRSC